MQRKETEGNTEDWIRYSDWVASELRISLQVLACESQNQINHFNPGSDIVGELYMDYWGYSQAIGTYWELSQDQETRLTVLRDFFDALNTPATGDFWSVEALRSDPRWEHVRSLAKQTLNALNWPIEVPPPEKDYILDTRKQSWQE